ncbi:MAG: nuclear transport factor 2 family protein [Streptosporangiaceae bacterium]|nr:nuclear transport factor 2 family protein [Streptosporangiaceae bacterium]MBV9853781.1 nuclear transport factor 2 family protein [Streptosporangiaceae bacterium]
MDSHGTAAIVRAYYDSWTSRDFARAVALLDGRLTVEVPVNDYPTAESFGAALKAFGSMAASVRLLAEMSAGNEAMLLYDMDVVPLGTLRVAEHFTVAGGRITRIRQIHDTAAIRAAGLAGHDDPAGAR